MLSLKIPVLYQTIFFLVAVTSYAHEKHGVHIRLAVDDQLDQVCHADKWHMTNKRCWKSFITTETSVKRYTDCWHRFCYGWPRNIRCFFHIPSEMLQLRMETFLKDDPFYCIHLTSETNWNDAMIMGHSYSVLIINKEGVIRWSERRRKFESFLYNFAGGGACENMWSVSS